MPVTTPSAASQIPAATLTLPIKPASLAPAREFVEHWSREAGLEDAVLRRFVFAASEVVEAVVVLAQEKGVQGEMRLEARPVEGWITLDVSFPAALPLEPVFEEGQGSLEQLPGKNLAPEHFWRHVVAEWVDSASWRQHWRTKTIRLTQYARPGGSPTQLYFLGLKPRALEDLAFYEVGDAVVAASPRLRSAFRLTPQSAFVLRLADGSRSVREIYRAYLERFGLVHPQVVGALVEELAAKGLLNLGRSLLSETEGKQGRRRLLSRLLALQYSLPHPDRLVEQAARWLGWAYTPQAGLVWLALVLLSIPLVWGNAQWAAGFVLRLDLLAAHLGVWGVVVPLLLLNLHILLHELSHCIVCKRLGGRIHALGVVFYYGLWTDMPLRRHHRGLGLPQPLAPGHGLPGRRGLRPAHGLCLRLGPRGRPGPGLGGNSRPLRGDERHHLLFRHDEPHAPAGDRRLLRPQRHPGHAQPQEPLLAIPEGPAPSPHPALRPQVGVSDLRAGLPGRSGGPVHPPLLVLTHTTRTITGVGVFLAELFVAVMALRVVKWALGWYQRSRGQYLVLKSPLPTKPLDNPSA